jgi:filamentous hemagglutinin family protein
LKNVEFNIPQLEAIDFGDIPASQQIVTELSGTNFTAELGILQADVH